MNTQRIASAVASIERDLRGMLDPLDIPLSWTGRELERYEMRRAELTQRLSTIRNTSTALSELSHERVGLVAWRDRLVQWEQTLQEELATLQRPLTEVDLGRRQNVEMSLRAISDAGTAGLQRDIETLRIGVLMQESGLSPAPPAEGQVVGRLPWFGSLPRTELRIAELDASMAIEQVHLDEALFTDAEREDKAKNDKARLEVARNAPQRKRRHDGTVFDKYPDGRCVEVIPASSTTA